MAKSKIIKDLANGDIDIQIALKRAKLLFDEFENDNIKQWINNEITGYISCDDLPDYRIQRGKLIGTYILGNMKYSNVSIPIDNMPESAEDVLLNIYVSESVSAIKRLIRTFDDGKSKFGKVIPAESFPVITKYSGNPYMRIISANVEGNPYHLSNIISTVENKLLDAFLLLEKEFGNLDDLDVDTSDKSSNDIKTFIEKIDLIINDNSVKIGDGNTIKKSDIK